MKKLFVITIALIAVLTVATTAQAQSRPSCYEWEEYVASNGDTLVAAKFCGHWGVDVAYSRISQDYSSNKGWEVSDVQSNRWTIGLHYLAKYDKMPVAFHFGPYVGCQSNHAVRGYDSGTTVILGAEAGIETSHLLDWFRAGYREDILSLGVSGFAESRNFVIGDPTAGGSPDRRNGLTYGAKVTAKVTVAHLPVPTSYGKRLLPVSIKASYVLTKDMKVSRWQNETERAKYNLVGDEDVKIGQQKGYFEFGVQLGF